MKLIKPNNISLSRAVQMGEKTASPLDAGMHNRKDKVKQVLLYV